MKDQSVKKDAGKLELSLVPTEIIEDVAAVMMFGAEKYSRGSWVNCEPQRYIDAMLRHIVLFLKDPDGVDKESGLPHLSHVATNVAFLCHFRRDKEVEE